MTKVTDLAQAAALQDGDIFYVVQGGVSFYCTGQQIKDLVEGGLTAAEVKALYEANPDTNAFTDAEKTKLAGIEAGATADQTEADTNAFTDAEKTKLANQSGTNTGDQTSIVGITGTKAEFDTACTDGDFLYVGDADLNDPNTALTNAVNNYSAQQYFGTQTLTPGATIDWNLNTQQVAELTLDQSGSLNAPTNLVAGGTYVLHVKQDSTGTWTLGFDAIFRFPGGTPPTITATADRSDVLTFYSDGTHLYLKSIEQDMDYTVAVPLAISQLGNNAVTTLGAITGSCAVAWLSTTSVAVLDTTGRIQKYNRVGADWVADGNLGGNLGGQAGIKATSFSPTEIVWSGPNYVVKHTYAAPNWSTATLGTVSGANDVAISRLDATDVAWVDQGLSQLRRYNVSGGAGSLALVGSGLSIPGMIDPDVTALDANNVAVIDTGLGTLRTYQDAGGGSWSAVGTPLAIAGLSGQVKVEAISATEVVFADFGNKEMRIYENSPNWQLSAVTPFDLSTILSGSVSGDDLAMANYDTDVWAFFDSTSHELRSFQKA